MHMGTQIKDIKHKYDLTSCFLSNYCITPFYLVDSVLGKTEANMQFSFFFRHFREHSTVFIQG